MEGLMKPRKYIGLGVHARTLVERLGANVKKLLMLGDREGAILPACTMGDASVEDC